MLMPEMIARIESREPFSWVRYGNGEWDLILGRGKRTGSGSQWFTHSLREAMRETVIHHHGKVMARQSEQYLRKVGLWGKSQMWLKASRIEIDWQSGEVLHRASLAGELGPFVQALNDPLFVGPQWLESLRISGDVMPIPEQDCWDDVRAIEVAIRQHGEGRTVCISAGPAAKVLIHRLHGENMQLIDCGSLWDVYCGKPSRKYHKAMSSEVIERNLSA